MKKIGLLICIAFSFFVHCKKKEITSEKERVHELSNDSLVHIFSDEWKYETIQYTPDTYTVLNNWSEWRLFMKTVQENKPRSIRTFREKVSAMLEDIDEVQKTVPEGFQNPRIFSRINVLKTHIQQLDMYLELKPIPEKKVQPLFGKIHKDIQVIIFQFKEKITKDQLPKSIQEPVLEYDTIKRANKDVFNT